MAMAPMRRFRASQVEPEETVASGFASPDARSCGGGTAPRWSENDAGANQSLYGALHALESALSGVGGRPAAAEQARSGGPQERRRASLWAEQAWRGLPDGGNSAFGTQRSVTTSRLQVARLQETLSAASMGLEQALEVCCAGRQEEVLANEGVHIRGADGAVRGGSMDSLLARELGQQTRDLAELQREASALEEEATRLQREEGRLQARLQAAQADLSRVRATKAGIDEDDAEGKQSISPRPRSPTRRKAEATENFGTKCRSLSSECSQKQDESKFAATVKLLTCLKEVAISNKSLILPPDTEARTPYQKIVGQFLEEVEACQTRPLQTML